MNDHSQIADLLPLFAAYALDPKQRLLVEQHLVVCAECRADLALWKTVSKEIVSRDQEVAVPRGLFEKAMRQAPLSPAKPASAWAGLRRVGQLLRTQMPLVQHEIWPASAAVIALGFVAAVISAHSGFIYALAPLIAATCVSLIYGPENDPAYELALATPTTPRQILLARLVLVFGYNLGLALIATLGLLPLLPQPLLGDLVLAWLAPMTFLSAAALVLSLWTGAPNAIVVTYIAWLVHLIAGPLRSPQATLKLSTEALNFMAAYQSFWQAPGLLLALAVVLFGLAAWLAGRQEPGLLTPA